MNKDLKKDGFLKIAEEMADFSELAESIEKNITPINLMGVSDSVRTHFISCAAKKFKRPLFVVAENEREALKICEDLKSLFGAGITANDSEQSAADASDRNSCGEGRDKAENLAENHKSGNLSGNINENLSKNINGNSSESPNEKSNEKSNGYSETGDESNDSQVIYYPPSDLLFYDVEASSRDIKSKRLRVLNALCSGERPHIVTTAAALCEIMPSPKTYSGFTRKISVGDEIDTDNIRETLTALGYTFEDEVSGEGQCSMRGGIFDFYPPGSDAAVRVELFDTEVDSVRLFSAETQRTIENINEAYITPADEIILTKESRNELIKFLEKEIKRTEKAESEAAKSLVQILRRDKERIENGVRFPSVHKYIPIIYKEENTVADFLSGDYIACFTEPGRLSETAAYGEKEFSENIKSLLERGIIPKTSFDYRKGFHLAMREITEKHSCIGLCGISYSCPEYRPKKIINVTAKTLNDYHGKTEFFLDALNFYRKNNYKVIILAKTDGKARSILRLLEDEGINAAYSKAFGILPEGGRILVTVGALSRGFEYPLIRTAVICEREIFGERRKKRRRRAVDKKNRINSFEDLTVGDYVVHQSHGVGKYMGTARLEVSGTVRDYLKIVYKGSDVLYVPTDQLGLVYKYSGGEGSHVSLNTLGGSDWAKTKQRVKKSCEDIAGELITLYAARETVRGAKCGEDDEWQRMFEAAFPYEETDDQLTSVAEIKADMEKSRPMERLLCGDVGYGKTEVAMRAAFKAVMNGYQVAYLVPTTILASQHTATFRQRMKDFPIRIAMLSRFTSASEQKSVIKELKSGEVDIVIGTHKLLSKTVSFKNLGLLIVDEEQRFGVRHKEQIKALCKGVDALTLSATPIPRTLHLSMSGLRDMSLITQPPGERYPVSTYVLEYDREIVREAINRELGRGGQVYYLFNRTSGIESAAENLRKMIPDAKIAVAHGKMRESELEGIMMDLYEGEIDVLVCTTIIETGLDIPNVNTIIIEDSDRLGLSQLYQLRGRVGRSDRLAYAYLTFRRDKVLNEDASKRLRAIKEFTEFGSGFKIAMRDLEIRGMGNLIGAQQSGHMESVGYEMYCKMLEAAIAKQKGLPMQEDETQTLINLPISAYIPEKYVKSSSARLSLYKKIATIENEEDLSDTLDEIADRFGDIPEVVLNLAQIALIKEMAGKRRFTEVAANDDTLNLYFDESNPPDMEKVAEFVTQNPLLSKLKNRKRPCLCVKVPKDKNVKKYIDNIKKTIEKI